MKNLTTRELRESYINFFKDGYSHTEIPGSSVIPEDASVLLTSAGMQQLIPYLMGESHPQGDKLCSIQKCFRTTDIEEIGDESHGSYFEMLGNWSLGSYFKKEAIEMAWEYLTNEMEIPKEKIYATIFEGDENIPFDEEAKNHWLEVGMSEDHINALGADDNFWIAGDTGPCGGDTEIHYDRGEGKGCGSPDCKPGCDCDRWLEIWNLVFMEYNKKGPNDFEKLAQQNVDTGMGLLRLAMLSQGVDTIYETDEMTKIIKKIEEVSGKSYSSDSETTKAMRIIADHLRSSIVMIEAGIKPANLGREYLLRRLIRRAVRYAMTLELSSLRDVVDTTIETMIPVLPNANKEEIKNTIAEEEGSFEKTIQKGLRELEKLQEGSEVIDGKKAFYLYETYGFPLELTEEEIGQKINEEEFKEAQKAHQEISRAGAESKKGGVGGCGEEGAANHTATHLLHQALKEVLGEEVTQRGSDVTPERLRFDFNYGEKMTEEQVKQVEDIVNAKIQESLPITCEEMSPDEAKASGAIGIFDDKYGDNITVYSAGDFSKEICGGPHIQNTSELKNFKIKSEKSSSKGVRRIKAVTNF
jgi:alanyl-tRNA synthetase